MAAEATQLPAALVEAASAESPVAEAKTDDPAPEALALAAPPRGVTSARADKLSTAIFFVGPLPEGGGETSRWPEE